jgi:LacI family transcriptional regulator, galactose operon repressor
MTFATQKDIAREAGVSQTIVSDVLQGRPRGRVSEGTRQRILETARRLGYKPNAMARALRSRQTRQVAYVIAQSEIDRYRPLEEPIVPGLAAGLGEQGYRLLIEVTPSHEGIAPAIEEMAASGVCDGCIVRSFEEQAGFWSALKQLEHPIVVIGQCGDPELPSVAHDAPAMVRTALRHLKERGHTRIGLFASRRSGDYHRLIHNTWHEAAQVLGLDSEHWMSGETERRSAEARAAGWLSAPDGPTAFICTGERAAVGVTDAAARAGRRFGKDLDLAVISNVTHAWLYAPGTWYFGTDLEAIGRRATAELLHLLEDCPSPGPIRILPELKQV